VGVAAGEPLTLRSAVGQITLPVRIADMPDRVVWVPENSPGAQVRLELGAGAGSIVTLAGGEA
jgi:NADH-quinone oxidoreductase subunit G